MTQEQVDSLLTEHAHVSSKRGSGIGVKNVNERIRLYFGNEYGLFIESEPDEGTTIRIHLPAVDYREILESVAEQSSICERRAQEAERESERLKKAEYMSYHLGEEFDGIISGVTAYGLYVELHNTVEGLVHISTLSDDYYTFDEENYELSGELTKKIYHLGQKVRVRVTDADALSRTVDFTIVE